MLRVKLENAYIHATKIGVFGDLTLKMGSSVNETHKRHLLARARREPKNKVKWKNEKIKKLY